MSEFVLDCSVAATWLMDDEAGAKTKQLFKQLQESGAIVPALWHLEVGNMLVQAERRRRITPAQVADSVRLANQLPVITDADYIRALHEVLNLARAGKSDDLRRRLSGTGHAPPTSFGNFGPGTGPGGGPARGKGFAALSPNKFPV